MKHFPNRGVLAAGCISALLFAASLSAATTPKVQFTDTRLKNDLRVIISEDHTAPVFSIAVTYNVGSRDERKGRTGFAHLFEHMMFKGSQNVGSGEHFLYVFNNGGDMNGTTNKDRTNYYERLPANQLDLALFLESDRMRALDINKTNLDNQIGTVSEERKQGVDNQPYGKTGEVIDEVAYENFAYEHSVIGSLADLAAATVDDVAAFFKTYYAPNNAVLSIVGDVNTKECLEKVRKYFESIPQQPAPVPVDMTEPSQTEERRQTLDDALARLPRIDVVYHVPQTLTPDHDAMTFLGMILSGGRSSRMYENIVRQKQLSSNVSASAGESRGPGLFRISGMVMPGKSVGDLEQAIFAEVERIKNGPIEDWELQKARNTLRRSLVSNLGNTLNRAIMLSSFAVYYNNPNLINTVLDRFNLVTAADIQRVAKQYLTQQNRTVVTTNPKPPAAASADQQKGGVQ
jgi:zinc protease